MKTINELTEQEILELTDEQIEKMCNLAKAGAGVKLMLEPEPVTYIQVPDKNVIVYEAAGHYFKNKEDADKVVGLISNSPRYCLTYTSSDWNNKYIYREENDAITGTKETKVWSNKLYTSIQELIKKNADLKQVDEGAWEEWNANNSKGEQVSSEIWDKVHAVRNKYRKLNNLIAQFKNQYIPLYSDMQDAEHLAMRAMTFAFKLDKEQESYILANYNKSNN